MDSKEQLINKLKADKTALSNNNKELSLDIKSFKMAVLLWGFMVFGISVFVGFLIGLYFGNK